MRLNPTVKPFVPSVNIRTETLICTLSYQKCNTKESIIKDINDQWKEVKNKRNTKRGKRTIQNLTQQANRHSILWGETEEDNTPDDIYSVNKEVLSITNRTDIKRDKENHAVDVGTTFKVKQIEVSDMEETIEEHNLNEEDNMSLNADP